MERKVNIQDWQKVTEEDFNNFGNFPRESFDHITYDVLIPDMAYTGFAVVQATTARVTVGNGRLYYNGKVYFDGNEGGTELDLLTLLPVATRKYIAVVVWGVEQDTDTEPRTFLTDAVTRATIAQVTSTTNERHANISTVAGVEGPDPVKPTLASNVCAVAWVLCDTSGIVSIEQDESNRAPSLREADSRLNENDAWRVRIGTRIDTLASDLAALALRILGTARQSFVIKMAADIARLRFEANLPETYTDWGADNFLTEVSSDIAHADYLAAVEEGIRFPDAAITDSQIGLLNQFDATVRQQDFFVLPVYSENPRITVTGKDSEQAISTYPFITVNTVQKSRVRTRYRYGPWFEQCSNWAFYYTQPWVNGFMGGQVSQAPSYNHFNYYDPDSHILRFDTGELFQIESASGGGIEDKGSATHQMIRARQVGSTATTPNITGRRSSPPPRSRAR